MTNKKPPGKSVFKAKAVKNCRFWKGMNMRCLAPQMKERL